MTDIISSDENILHVNQALYDALSEYIDTASVAITFDLPAVDSLPSEPTLSVFLYEIHEDLRMRAGGVAVKNYNSTDNSVRISPAWVNVNCNYIITYWDSEQGQTSSPGSPGAMPDNQGIRVMNQVVNALINNRQLADMPGAYTRMIPPKDELNSLGNFWQSLGNKPRLSLNVSVTIPVSLTDPNNAVPGVKTTLAEMSQL